MNTKRPPILITILYCAVFVAPLVYGFFFSTYNNLCFTPYEQWKVYLALPLIIYFAIVAVIAAVMYKVFIGKICAYDGSDFSYKESISAFKILQFFTMLFPIALAFIYPAFATMAESSANVETNFWALMYVSVNSGCLVSVFFSSLWYRNFSEWACFLPLKEQTIHFGVLSNIMVTTFFDVWGVFAGVMSTVLIAHRAFAHMDGHSFAANFVVKWIPFMITSIVFSVANMGTIIGHLFKRVKKVNNFAFELAHGNYTVGKMVVQGRDEFGSLVNSLNLFYDNTKTLLCGLQENVDGTLGINVDLNSNITETSACMNAIVSTINNVQRSMESQEDKIEGTIMFINEILNRIEGLDKSIETQSAGVEESSAAVRQMVSNIESVTKVLAKNKAESEKLDKASEIGLKKVEDAAHQAEKILAESAGLIEASSVIQSIADQTNLLAMNAAIEAAHAGDLGKGFAVVADQIGKLADESNLQGRKIAESLNELEAIIKSVSDSTKAVQDQFSVIFNMTHNVNQQEGIVMNAMQEQSEGSQQILLAMKSIDDSTSNVRDEAAAMVKESRRVEDEMQALVDINCSVNNAMLEMTTNTDEIMKALQNINNTVNRNTDSLNNLENEMNKFSL